MEDPVVQSLENVVLGPVVMESPDKLGVGSEVVGEPTTSLTSKVAGTDGSTAKGVGIRSDLTSKLGANRSRVSRTSQNSTAVSQSVRRNSTGGLGEKQSVPTRKHQGSAGSTGRNNSCASGSEPLRRSFPEMRSSMISCSSKSRSIVLTRETKKLGLVSPGTKALRTTTSSSGSKTVSVNKPSFTQSTSSSSRKFNSSSLDSTASSTVKNSVSKLSTPSAKSCSVASGVKRATGFPSPLARSPSLSSAVKKGSLSSSRDQGSNLSGRKKVVTPEQRDSHLTVLPQVEIKGGDDVRLDLRGQRICSLKMNGMNLSQNLEFVYLRDNLLSSLEGIEILKHVKVLDLSFNDFKGPGFEPLGNCKVLQQLYLAGNQITSLSSLPELPNLEFLSVAQNKLKSLSMASQPRLQVLAASKNKISSLKGFPHLPVLEHLRVEENPILRMSHLEAASILLIGPTLKKFNDRDLSKEEIAISKHYPTHTALCIRDGWEFCSPEHATESTFNFLVELWKDHLPPGFQLKEASIDPPFEEDACRCHFIFLRDHGIGTKLVWKYQWYVGERALSTFNIIPDDNSEVYSPKHDDVGKYLKVECIPVLGETEYPPIFAISSMVSSGTGCPKVLNLDVRGDLVEGNIIRGFAEVAWCGGTPGNGVASWLRRKWNNSPVLIFGAEDEEYQLTMDDIDSSLVFMYTPVTKEGTKGEPQYAVTDFVKAAPPFVSNVRIIGEYVEGNVIKGVGDYFGGHEGPSKFEWLREDKETGKLELVLAGAAEYILTREDVGHRMAFNYIPVNFEGKEGEFASTVSDVVRQAPPKVTSIRIVGVLREGSKIIVTGTVTGGTESSSRVQWFKSKSSTFIGEEGLEALSLSKNSKAFRIPLGAVGHYIVAKFTPMTPDGEAGKPAYVVSENTIETLSPSLNFLSVTGDYAEGEMLTASYGYMGGHEGKSIYNWYLHEVETDTGTLINEVAGHLQFRLPKQAIGKFISFKCIPARDDCVIGEPGVCMGKERVRAGSPRVISLHIVGKSIEGSTLIVDKAYCGGEEGESIFRWFRMSSDWQRSEICGATMASYMLSVDDIGCFISVSCEPVRSDWARGPVVLSEQFGPIAPGIPTCQTLELSGSMIEGQRLTFIAFYSGGARGNCFHEWFRVESNGCKEKLCANDFLDLVLEDVGCCIELVFTPVRNDGERGTRRTVLSDVIMPGIPRIDKLEIEGRGFHTNLYAVQGLYSGGKEGKSRIQWLRSMIGSPDLISIPGETGRMYEANVDDVGYRLVAIYTPVREDGVEGKPITSSTEPIAVEPDIFEEVKKKLDLGSVKFEVLCNKSSTSKKSSDIGGLEKRILEINRKRVKVVKPGSKTSFPSTELRGSYAPPFHVELFRNDQHRLRVVVDSENEVDIMVHTRHLRDVIVLVLRGLAQKFNSTSLNTLLKIET